MRKGKNAGKMVLVGVLKSVRDREILMRERWYRIPLARLPAHPFRYLAFYKPARLGRGGKRIRYYAKVCGHETMLRRELFPAERRYPRANERYVKFLLGPIQKLARPVRNSGSPRRVSFGFTTLHRLRSSKDMLQLFEVPPTEDVMRKMLRRENIPAIPQYPVVEGKRRFRLDFAVLCRRGGVAVECDNKKAHAGKTARRRGAVRDRFLEKRGWTVLHFSELAVQHFMPECIKKIRSAVRSHGGEHGTIRMKGR